jgi:apolipoprotein N-acyltransferase
MEPLVQTEPTPGDTRKPQPDGLTFRKRQWMALGVGALLAACFPPFSLSFLLPLPIALLIRLLRGVTVRQAFYIGLPCGLVFYSITLCWLANIFQAAAISLWAIAAFYPALFAALFVWLRGRFPPFPEWLLAALVWTGVEYFRSEIMWPTFAWMGLGYSLVNAPVLAAVASWLGSYGLSFVVVAFGGALASSFSPVPSEGEQSARPASLFARFPGALKDRKAGRVGLLLAGWLFLWLLPRHTPSPASPIQVRLVQADSEDDENLFALSQTAPGAHVDIIVWPEYSFLSDPRQNPKLWPKLMQVAREHRCYLLFGAKDPFDTLSEDHYRNTAFLLSPAGEIVGKHVKNHPVHFFRDGVAGTEARAIHTDLGLIGVGICFDMDYGDVARRLTASGAAALLVPSDNPQEWGPLQHLQHRQLFQMRAIECGRWLATADVAGSTFVVAPTGAITTSISTPQPTALNASIGRETGRTVYIRGGWRFGPLCLLALALLCAGTLLPNRAKRVTHLVNIPG